MMDNPRFSIIVPVYNRIDEVSDLLGSLQNQTLKNFELIIVEDGSTEPCDTVVKSVKGIDVSYYYKDNEGRSIARNHGLDRAKGDYFVFFDSDCVIPADYFEVLSRELDATPADCFGGPDSAHESFTSTQKAINFAMTSFLTTGGIRGGKVSLEKFVPRTFNMGFSREVYERVGRCFRRILTCLHEYVRPVSQSLSCVRLSSIISAGYPFASLCDRCMCSACRV